VVSAIDAAELYLFQTLSAAITDARVFQDVPAGATGDLVIIGDVESFPFAATNDPDRRISVTIITLTQGDERAPCTALQAQIETAFAGVSVLRDPWNLHSSIESSSAVLDEQGEGYLGTTILQILAFRED
jgi:hypothetical protein